MSYPSVYCSIVQRVNRQINYGADKTLLAKPSVNLKGESMTDGGSSLRLAFFIITKREIRLPDCEMCCASA